VYAKIHSIAVDGIDAFPVEVEVFLTQSQLPSTMIVGLPDLAVKESKERVKAAMRNSGFSFPVKVVTINLAPADRRKEGPAFDLPMALALLAADGPLETGLLAEYAITGELGLDGIVRPVRGVLSMTLEARKHNMRGIIVPEANAREAAVVEGIDVIPVRDLGGALSFLDGSVKVAPFRVDISEVFRAASSYDIDFADVRGQENVKRALEVAASGGHNVLMIGPPGAGKSMLSQRLPTILPDLSIDESLETTRIYSVAGMLKPEESLLANRPFRAPHHTISTAGLIGGGSHPGPGEVSLAHNGVLFLDELPEFERRTLEVMRQPMEDGCVTISRASGSVTFPSRFMLVCAQNPCPCGYWGDRRRVCRCTPFQIQKYKQRISGPLLDRIDIHVNVPAVPFEELAGHSAGESSEDIRRRVVRCRLMQHERFASEKGKRRVYTNSQMTPKMVRKYCRLDGDAEMVLHQAMNAMGLSARAYTKILKLARTIADLDERKDIGAMHVSEAVQYRNLDQHQEI